MLPALLFSAFFVAVAQPSSDVSALTDAQKKKCYQDWAGKVFQNNNGSQQYRGTGCPQSKDGTCRVTSIRDPDTRDTSYTAQCQRQNGEFSNGSANWATPADEGGSEEPEDPGAYTSNDPVAGDDCGGVQTAIIKCDAKNSGDLEDNGVWALLLIGLNILTTGVGILAIAGIVYGAVLYTTAEDKADQVKKATDIITNVVIGLIAFALMWAGLNFIVPGGVFA